MVLSNSEKETIERALKTYIFYHRTFGAYYINKSIEAKYIFNQDLMNIENILTYIK